MKVFCQLFFGNYISEEPDPLNIEILQDEENKKKNKKDSSFTDKYKMKENKENLKTKKNGGFSDHVYQKATDFNFFTDFQLIFQVDRITNCIYQLKEKRL